MEDKKSTATATKPANESRSDRDHGGRRGNRNRKPQRDESPYMEKVIRINRVTKVCKGGKRLAFRALVIVGDQKGKVSLALGKSTEVPGAIKKGIERAKKSLQSVNIVEGTLPHAIIGVFGSAKVIMKPASPGTGVIAGGSVRILLEAAGLKNVVAKSLGSDNPINTARAALQGLASLRSKEQEEINRGKSLPIRYVKLDESTLVTKKVVKEDQGKPKKESNEKKKDAAKKKPSKPVTKKEQPDAKASEDQKPKAKTSEVKTEAKEAKKSDE